MILLRRRTQLRDLLLIEEACLNFCIVEKVGRIREEVLYKTGIFARIKVKRKAQLLSFSLFRVDWNICKSNTIVPIYVKSKCPKVEVHPCSIPSHPIEETRYSAKGKLYHSDF